MRLGSVKRRRSNESGDLIDGKPAHGPGVGRGLEQLDGGGERNFVSRPHGYNAGDQLVKRRSYPCAARSNIAASANRVTSFLIRRTTAWTLNGSVAVWRFTPICDEVAQKVVQMSAVAYYAVSSSLTPRSSMFYGRGLRHLSVAWGVSLLLLVGLYRIEVVIPALHDMIVPVYWVVAGFTAFMTLRWLRARSPQNRRGKDRRHADRRGDASAGPEA